ncbi:MAG: pyridoxine 5'-phosphate synthase [Candidatus Omnitrophota bacterium]
MPKLGVNVDHVATLREARGGKEPRLVNAVSICEAAGCDSIVAHLREDRRHINDLDVKMLRKNITTRFNLEMSINKEIVGIAKKIKPDQATLVPERRRELTTEGGLDVYKNSKKIAKASEELLKNGIEVSLFIDPDKRQIRATRQIGVNVIEIHTGMYSLAAKRPLIKREYNKIKDSINYALDTGLLVNAGHGLDYINTKMIAGIKGINELNIGHSIISRSLFVGLYQAVKEMKGLAR